MVDKNRLEEIRALYLEACKEQGLDPVEALAEPIQEESPKSWPCPSCAGTGYRGNVPLGDPVLMQAMICLFCGGSARFDLTEEECPACSRLGEALLFCPICAGSRRAIRR